MKFKKMVKIPGSKNIGLWNNPEIHHCNHPFVEILGRDEGSDQNIWHSIESWLVHRNPYTLED